MQAEGIHLEAITPQNEPLNPNNNPSMYMTSEEQKNFIKNNLGPAFYQANLTTKIILYDHNCDHPEYAINILNDPDARQYIDGSAFHLYAGDISALTQTHLAHPDKNVYFTEQWVGGPSNFGPDMQWHVKNLIIGATRNWSKNVLEWNLASDPYYKPHTDGGCNSCEGALTIASSVSRNVSYYIIAHASKFVKSGSVRISSDMPTHLPNVAFKTPEGKKVLIVLNEGSSKQYFNIKYGGRQAVAGLDPGVVATFIW
jgi:glucosylceramidase